MGVIFVMAHSNGALADALKESQETQFNKNGVATQNEASTQNGAFSAAQSATGRSNQSSQHNSGAAAHLPLNANQTPQRRVGITLPQPTSKIIELKPLYSIIEPKPLYEGVALEVPGQKRVPQFQSDTPRSTPLRLPLNSPSANSTVETTSQESLTLRKSLSSDVRTLITKPSYDKLEKPQKNETVNVQTPTDASQNSQFKPQVISQQSAPKLPNEPTPPAPPVAGMTKPEVISFEMAQNKREKMGAETGDSVEKPTPEEPKPTTSKQDKLRLLYEQLKGSVDGGVQEAGFKNDSPMLTPDAYLNTLRMSDQYLGIADAGGWPILPANTVLSPGSRNATVTTLKQRLLITQDIEEKDAKGDFYDEKLIAAVKRFQARHGLALTGTVSGATLDALNVPAITRYRQLKGTAERLVQRSFRFGGRYLTINIASGIIEAVEEGRVVQRFKAKVGPVEHQTPPLESEVKSITLNPIWTIPPEIMARSILVKLQQNPMMLPRLGLQAYDQKGAQVDPSTIDWNKPEAMQLVVKHPQGGTNPLGRLKLNLTHETMLKPQKPQQQRSKKEREKSEQSKLAQTKAEPVLIHDTPSKRLSMQDDRTWASNAVQIVDSRALSAWILNSPMIYTPRTIQGLMATNTTQELPLPAPLPVKLIYMTGYVTDDGTVHFRSDPYALDVQQRSTKVSD